MRPGPPRLIVSALAFAWASCLAAAEEAGQADEPPRHRLTEVVVEAESLASAGPFLPDMEGARINTGKKTRRLDLQARPPAVNNNYRQALATTPGLLLSEETTPLLSIGYRGLPPDRVQFTQVLMDGVPITADMFGYPEAYYTPPFQTIDHIEFVHGGAALQYGPQPGGALNFVTKAPAEGTPLALSTEQSFGTDALFSTYTALTGAAGDAGYLGYFHEREGNGFRETNSDFEVIGSGLKIVLELPGAPDARLTLNYDEYHEEHGEPGGLTRAVAESDGRDRTFRFDDRFRLERYAGTLLYEHDLSEADRVELRTFGGHYRRYSKRQNGGGFGTAPTGPTNAIQEQDFYTFGFEPRFRRTYGAFGQPDHALSVGLLSYFSESPIENQTGATRGADSGSLTSRLERSMQYLALFAENRFTLGRLSLVPGARLEHLWQHLDEEVNTAKTAVPLGDADEFDFVPLFGVGSAYELTPAVEAYANFSQGYRPKTFAQAVPTGATQVVNGDLEEGQSWTLDVGLRGQRLGPLTWDASYFVMSFKNQIGTSGNTVDNVGDAVHHGLELAAEADLAGAYDAAAGTALRQRLGTLVPFATLMLLDAEFEKGPQQGKRPQYAPEHTLRFGTQYRWRDRVQVVLSALFLDDHFGDDANTTNQFIPAYHVWDLTGRVRLWKPSLSLFGGINNLFDARYWTRATGGGIDPAYARSIYGGIEARVRF
jgi:Fe(3+) dicitrate transport protein